MIRDPGEARDIQAITWTECRIVKIKHMIDFLLVFLSANTCVASAVIASATFMPLLVAWVSGPPEKRPVLNGAQWTGVRTSVLMLVGLAYSQFRICCSVLTNRFPEFDLDALVSHTLDSTDQPLLETCQLMAVRML